MNKKINFGLIPYFVWSLLFIVAPTVIVVAFAFSNENSQITVENFIKIKGYFKIIIKSLIYTTIATFVCFLIAYPVSYYASKIKNNIFKKIFIIAITLPMWTNLLLRTYSWMTILENNGILNNILRFFNIPTLKIINTPIAIIVVMAYDFLPFMILPIYTTICKIDENLIAASEDLGANNIKTFKLVILPLSVPGILTGISVVFVSCSCCFLIPRLLGGGLNTLIGELIETQFMGTIYNPWFGSALATFFMILIGTILALTNRINKTERENLNIWQKKFFLKFVSFLFFCFYIFQLLLL